VTEFMKKPPVHASLAEIALTPKRSLPFATALGLLTTCPTHGASPKTGYANAVKGVATKTATVKKHRKNFTAITILLSSLKSREPLLSQRAVQPGYS
jgi:hypothetical protein